jgi:hypothetical protein
MHFDGVVILVLAGGVRVKGFCVYCVVLCMCKCYHVCIIYSIYNIYYHV